MYNDGPGIIGARCSLRADDEHPGAAPCRRCPKMLSLDARTPLANHGFDLPDGFEHINEAGNGSSPGRSPAFPSTHGRCPRSTFETTPRSPRIELARPGLSLGERHSVHCTALSHTGE